MIEKAALIGEGFVELPGVRAPSAVYLLMDDEGRVLYAGQAKQVYQRITAHYNAKRKAKKLRAMDYGTSPSDARLLGIPFTQVLVRWVPKADLDREELRLIDRFDPPFNVASKTDRQARLNRAKVKVDIEDIANKLGFHHWMASRPDILRKRRVL